MVENVCCYKIAGLSHIGIFVMVHPKDGAIFYRVKCPDDHKEGSTWTLPKTPYVDVYPLTCVWKDLSVAPVTDLHFSSDFLKLTEMAKGRLGEH